MIRLLEKNHIHTKRFNIHKSKQPILLYIAMNTTSFERKISICFEALLVLPLRNLNKKHNILALRNYF